MMKSSDKNKTYSNLSKNADISNSTNNSEMLNSIVFETRSTSLAASLASNANITNTTLRKSKPLARKHMLKNARKQLEKMKFSLVKKFGEEREPLFRQVKFGPSNDVDATKRGRDYIKRKFLKAIATQGNFTITTLGTSVSAGHDNLYSESHPFVIQREMEALLATAGVTLRSLNHAMGNQPVIPMCLCMHTMGDPDTDLYIHEFNMMVGGAGPHFLERFMRSAYSHKNQPAVINIHGNMQSCNGDWGGQDGQWDTYNLFKHYNGFGLNWWYLEQAVSTSEGNKACSQDPSFGGKAMMGEDKKIAHYGWHPGPHGHYFIGMSIAYSYAYVFIEALEEYIELTADTEKMRKLESLISLDNPFKTLPPLFINSEGFWNTEANLECYTVFEPKGSPGMDITKFVVEGKVHDTRPTLPTPCDPAGGQKCLHMADFDSWYVGIWPMDESIAAENNPKAHYADVKWTFMGRKGSGLLTFEFYAQTDHDEILICHPPGGFGHIDGGIEVDWNQYDVKIDGNKAEVKETVGGICSVFKQKYSKGNFRITIDPSNLSTGKLLAISHILLPFPNQK